MDKKHLPRFAQRLNTLIDQSDKAASTIAAELSVSKQAMSTWRSGLRTPKRPTLETIARYFGVNPDWLAGKSDAPAELPRTSVAQEPWHDRLMAAYATAHPSIQQSVCKLLDIDHLPTGSAPKKRRPIEMIVFDHPAAAGMPLYAEPDFERLSFPAQSIPDGADFGVRISGDSMLPTLSDGQIVWVEQTGEIFNGQIGIFMLGTDAVCKRAQVRADGRILRLTSDNRAYADLQGHELAQLRVVGRVLG